jgi:acyl transferase domain-containing protein
MKSGQATEQKIITTPIAVIGMASIFPQARTLPAYWENILNKIDAIIDVPESRWKIDEYYDPNPAAVDKTYCKRGGFIPDVEFDPAEFGLPPNLLEVTDVTQLLSLVVAKECLEDAGYGEGRDFSRENMGVILGLVGIGSKLVIPLMARLQYPVWEKVLRSYGIPAEDIQKIIDKIKLAYPNWEENSFPGSIGNVVSGRIANRFDLGGTNCVVDAACGSSLAAVRMAVGELIEGKADMMITGGVDLDNSIGAYLCFSKTPAFSKGSNVRTFDKDSDGMMVGEGIGMVMLKRLDDARRDGDRIYAVIKGVGTSSDGRFKSIYAPRPAGQSLALRRAYNEAGYSPATVGLIEAHGTGTMAGDPAEFQGLNEVFSQDNPNLQYIALGSVKSQIAHTKAAAGVASLIKASLALYHKVLPATINVTTPNPKLNIEKSPFYLNTEIRPWIKPAGYPRRAGVSSFGFGGTNFHVALEENEPEHNGAYRVQGVPQVIVLSAKTPEELQAVCQSWSTKLQSVQAKNEFLSLASSWKAQAIPQNDARVGFVAATPQEAAAQLAVALDLVKSKGSQDSAEHPAGVYYRKTGIDSKGKLVALFPGQGSQYVDMGRELAVSFPPIREAFAEMDSHFAADELPALSSVVYPIPAFESAQKDGQAEKLTRTEHAQPAIGSLSVGMYRLLKEAGFSPDFVAGHSFGELTALWAAGVYDDSAYYTLAKARGKAMAPPADPNFDAGTMLAVKGDVEKLQADLKDFPEITLANFNANNQVVLAGSRPAVAAVQKALVEKGYSVVALQVSAAFHTPLVGHAQKPFADVIRKVEFRKPAVRVYSNTSGKAYGADPEPIRQTLAEHILNPVRFKDEIEAIYAEGGTIFVECGPKNVLTNLVKNILDGKPHAAIALNANAKKDSDRQYRDAVAQLCVLGLDLRAYDPYAQPAKAVVERKKSSISLMLGGGLYLSEKTRSAFDNAISQKNTLHMPGKSQPASPVPAAPAPLPASVVPAAATAPAANPDGLAQLIDQLRSLQSEALKAHSQFLSNDGEYARIFGQLTQQELGLLAGNPSQAFLEQINTALQTLERSMTQFNQHQAETLRVHEQYLRSQSEFIASLAQISQVPGAITAVSFVPAAAPAAAPASGSGGSVPVSSNGNGHYNAPAAAPVVSLTPKLAAVAAAIASPVVAAPSHSTAPTVNAESLKKALLEVVSEKTGYPVEMLDLGMDMEADLGIDSIKRVEIMGAIQARFPQLPKADAAALADMRTLGQIVDYMSASAAPAPSTVAAAPVIPAVAAPVAAPATVTSQPAVSAESLKKALLEVVSEKTGYPVEMLDLGMDMEADLGIDSIKRVEIMGAIQARFPELPKADAAALADMRTLGQIVNSMSASVASPAPAPSLVAAPVSTPTPAPAPAAAGTSLEVVTNGLLEIVSEKTGYPTEMLAPGMDMEADLGIDSIKRVEILGAMQARFPELPKLDAPALADLRTLSQIIEALTSVAGSAPAGESAQMNPAAAVVESDVPDLPRGVVALKSLPAPDHLDASFPADHTCLVMDDGTALTPALAGLLAGEGHNVVVLSLPEGLVSRSIPLPPTLQRVALEDVSEIGLQNALKAAQKLGGPAAVYIHLDPPAASSEAFSENEKSIVKMAFLAAKHLKDALTASAQNSYAAFMAVTRLDGEFGLSSAGAVEPVSGGLFGLVKTLNLEWDKVSCRAVDLDPAIDAQTAAGIILAELYDPNRLVCEVSYNPRGRFTLVVEQPVQEA